MDRDTADRLFYEHFDEIGGLVSSAARDLNPIEAEELDIFVKEKLSADDYRRIRAYQGRNGASFTTFLAAVIANLLKDFRDHLWGKVRPTEKARQKGTNAILLERLLRERHSFEEAFEIMTTDYSIAMSREQFEDLIPHVNLRYRVRAAQGEPLEAVDSGRSPEEMAIVNQMLERYCALLKRLRQICENLLPEDALIVKFRFEDGRRVSDIPDLLGMSPNRRRGKDLYRRLERLMGRLRESLEAGGFSALEVAAFLSNPGLGDGCDELEAG